MERAISALTQTDIALIGGNMAKGLSVPRNVM